MTKINIPGIRVVPETGVIYTTHRANEAGYTHGDEEWANLGQGMPEATPLEGAPERIKQINIKDIQLEYSPTQGIKVLRQKVADLYNHFYRQGKSSQYTYENVSIAGGGRVALTRVAASLENINLGHLIPDYTAYEELLSIFKAFNPIPIQVNGQDKYKLSSKKLEKVILGTGLQGLLLSNPCNPTGQLVEGEHLAQWIEISRRYGCTMIFDEFYSHYIYTEPAQTAKMVSAAAYVEDVNQDPIIIIDGLTKGWRYPGWRLSWTVAPRTVIEAVASAGSFLDGGPNHPFQSAALPLLEPENALAETRAIQKAFFKKRDYLLKELPKLGLKIEVPPEGAFYMWVNLSKLPQPLNDGLSFFYEGLKEKVVSVPGIFFDVNPGHRRQNSHYQEYSRISFGPSLKTLEKGVEKIKKVIDKFK